MRRRIKKTKRTFKRKRKGFFSGFFFSITAFSSIIVLSAGAFLLFSPRFQIKELSIIGNNDISTDDIKRVASEQMQKSVSLMGKEIKTGSIFLSLGGGVDSLKDSFPQIESIAIEKNFPNRVSLKIKEKTPYANWCEEYEKNNCYLVDRKGSFIKNIEEKVSGLACINEKEKYEEIEKKDSLACFDKIKGELAKNSINVLSFNIYKDKTLVRSNLNCDIIFNIEGDLDWQIEKLGIVLKNDKYSKDLNKLEYIDLRFGNQAIIK